MRITKKQLKRIIKEEKRKFLREKSSRSIPLEASQGTYSVRIETVDPEATLDPEFVLMKLKTALDQWAMENRDTLGELDIMIDLDYLS